MKLNKICLFLVLAFTLLSCGTVRTSTNPSIAVDAISFEKDQVWRLVNLRGKKLPSATGRVTLTLYPEGGSLCGLITCDHYSANYVFRFESATAEGSRYSIEIKNLGSEGIQCPEADMALQERYLGLLAKANACLLTPYTLTFFHNGKETLRYELE